MKPKTYNKAFPFPLMQEETYGSILLPRRKASRDNFVSMLAEKLQQ